MEGVTVQHDVELILAGQARTWSQLIDMSEQALAVLNGWHPENTTTLHTAEIRDMVTTCLKLNVKGLKNSSHIFGRVSALAREFQELTEKQAGVMQQLEDLEQRINGRNH